MNKKLIRDGFEYYLEIEAEGGEDYEYQMLLANHMASILPVNVLSVNEKRQLIYSASGFKSLESCIEKMVINGEQILLVMDSVLNGIDDIKRYLLSPDNLVLSADCLFVESDYSKAGLIYVPGYHKDIILQLQELMEVLLGRIDASDIKSVVLAWKLHTLIKDEHISLREIRKIMEGYKDNSPALPEAREETEEHPEYLEIKRTFLAKKKEKKFKKGMSISMPFLVSLICMAVLGITDIAIIMLIYIGGIRVWKRNLMLIVTILFFVCIGITVTLWKKEQVIDTIRKLQDKVREHMDFS